MTSTLDTPARYDVGFDVLLRDLRHMEARAAGDLADWLVHMDLEGKAHGTLYQYSLKIASLLRAHPHKQLGDFSHTDINEVLRLVPQRSRHISRSIFNQFFEWAFLDDRIPVNPVLRVPKMKHPRRRPKDIFSDAEVAMLEGLPTPDGQLFTILFGTGLRQGEARKLRREHVDLSRARLVVYHGKGDKDRIVPLPPAVLAAFSDLDLLCRLERDEYVWSLARNVKYQGRRYRTTEIGSTTYASWYTRRLKLAGLDRYLNPHQTRHTFGHLLRERGFDLEERQLLMGHESSETTTRYYGHLTIEDVAKKVAVL